MSTATLKNRPGSDTRREQVASLKERLANWQELTDAGLIAEYLARFDGYSPRNAMLVAMQRPEATEVRGFRAWLGQGRCVRKGEHGIQILAPAGNGRSKADRDTDTDDSEDKGPRFFRIAYVFDVAQTDEISEPQS